MKHTALFLLLLSICLYAHTQDRTKNKNKLLTEIDLIKEDPLFLGMYPIIENVLNDVGRLGLRGDVRLVKENQTIYKKSDILNRMIYTFNKEGKMHELKSSIVEKLYNSETINLVYGEHGQVIQADFQADSVTVHYQYDENGHIIGKKYEKENFPSEGSSLQVTSTFEYNDNNDIKSRFTLRIITSPAKSDTINLVEMYSYKYDKYGNWNEQIYMGNGKVLKTTRDIYYYPDNYYSSVDTTGVDTEYVYRQDEVDITPEYQGGEKAMQEFIFNNLVYPEKAQREKAQGRVFVTFTIMDDGSVQDIKVREELHPLLDAEAVRLVKKMNKWQPALKNGKAVSSNYVLPIVFRLR